MMKNLLIAAILGLTSIAGAPGVTSPVQAAASGWCYYGRYNCNCNAQSAARYLRSCGYCTYVCRNGSCYDVYYH